MLSGLCRCPSGQIEKRWKKILNNFFHFFIDIFDIIIIFDPETDPFFEVVGTLDGIFFLKRLSNLFRCLRLVFMFFRCIEKRCSVPLEIKVLSIEYHLGEK